MIINLGYLKRLKGISLKFVQNASHVDECIKDLYCMQVVAIRYFEELYRPANDPQIGPEMMSDRKMVASSVIKEWNRLKNLERGFKLNIFSFPYNTTVTTYKSYAILTPFWHLYRNFCWFIVLKADFLTLTMLGTLSTKR